MCPHRAIANLLQPASTLCDVGPVCVPIELASSLLLLVLLFCYFLSIVMHILAVHEVISDLREQLCVVREVPSKTFREVMSEVDKFLEKTCVDTGLQTLP